MRLVATNFSMPGGVQKTLVARVGVGISMLCTLGSELKVRKTKRLPLKSSGVLLSSEDISCEEMQI